MERQELRLHKEFPFLEYATKNVLYHANAAQGYGVNQSSFLQTFHLPTWIKLDNIFHYIPSQHTLNATLLYMLAEYNMGNLIRVHPAKLSCFEVEDEHYGPPIFAALAEGSGDAFRAFIEAHVEIKPSTSPIHALSEQYCQSGNERATSYFGGRFLFSRRRGALSHLAEQGDEAMFLAFFEFFYTGKHTIDLRDNCGRTALSWVAERGYQAAAKLLLDNGAGVEERDNYGQTPFSWAAKGGDEAVVKLLLDNGAKLEQKNRKGQTPLSRAAENGQETVVKLLLDNGADLEQKNTRGRTPLSWAAKNGHEAVVKLLLDKGADLEQKNKRGWAPLSWAAKKGHWTIVKLLLDKGANVEQRDERGRTPLTWAVEKSYDAIVKLLLERGADPHPITVISPRQRDLRGRRQLRYNDYQTLVSEPESAQLAADFMRQTRLLRQFKGVMGRHAEFKDSDSDSSDQDEH